MANAKTPEQRAALKKKHDKENDNLNKKHDDADNKLRNKHDKENDALARKHEKESGSDKSGQGASIPGVMVAPPGAAGVAAGLAGRFGDSSAPGSSAPGSSGNGRNGRNGASGDGASGDGASGNGASGVNAYGNPISGLLGANGSSNKGSANKGNDELTDAEKQPCIDARNNTVEDCINNFMDDPDSLKKCVIEADTEMAACIQKLRE